MSGSYFEQKDLQELQNILRSELGLEIAGDELYTAAISSVRFTAAKLLRHANLLNNINLNGEKQDDENSKVEKE
ncbi:MAG: hypothetical protein Q4F61_03600 [Candidatus Saccharibacteria bacterium]|nr:hypothetical protein [Candidatus Saccharibacteria bacterium]